MTSFYYSFAKFGSVGTLTALLFFLVMWLSQTLLGMYYLVAVSIAYVMAILFNFLMHRHYTFQAHQGDYRHQLLRYLFLVGVNYVITILIVSVCVTQFLISSYLSACIAALLTMMMNYTLGRYWIFR